MARRRRRNENEELPSLPSSRSGSNPSSEKNPFVRKILLYARARKGGGGGASAASSFTERTNPPFTPPPLPHLLQINYAWLVSNSLVEQAEWLTRDGEGGNFIISV